MTIGNYDGSQELQSTWRQHADLDATRQWIAVWRRARELLANPVATREVLTAFLLSKGWRGKPNDSEVTDILAAIAYFAPSSPPPPEGLPSVEDVQLAMENAYRKDLRFQQSGIFHPEVAARVAHAMMLELAPRQKMQIEGMTVDQIQQAMLKAGANRNSRDYAKTAHRLANTPAEPAPDPDAGAKQLAATWQAAAKIPLSNPWDKMKEDQRNGWRAVAAAQKKE